MQAARSLGNSIQAAPSRDEFESQLLALGFSIEVVEQPKPVEANSGFKSGHVAPTAPSAEHMTFEALVFHATK